MRLSTAIILLSSLCGCAALGPPAIDYSRSDLEERAFFERKSGDFKEFLAGLEGIGLTGPEVGIMTASQRLEFAWSAELPGGPFGLPLNFRIALSGSPKLNANKQGIDLTDIKLEEFSIPFMSMSGAKLKQGAAMGSIPLLQFDPAELRRDGVVYQPDKIKLGLFGLHVGLLPK